jgi:outer membrane protein assembly factor BamB
VVGDYKGYLHWLSPDDGKVVARTRLAGNDILTQPVASGDLLYVMDIHGNLGAYNVKPPPEPKH